MKMTREDLWNQSREHFAGYRETDPEQMVASLGSARLIDVREPFEFDSGHVPGSELVPLSELAAAATHWDKNEHYVMICRSGARSGRAAGYLASMGFSRVINLAGGMIQYGARGLAVERAA